MDALRCHWHDLPELVLVRQGEGEFSINLISHQVQAGDIVIIPHESLHSAKAVKSTTMDCLAIVFSLDFLQAGKDEILNKKYFEPLQHNQVKLQPIITKDEPWYQEIREALLSLVEAKKSGATGWELQVRGDFLRLWSFLIRGEYVVFQKQLPPLQGELTKLRQVLEYIRKHYSQPLTVKELAAVSGYSSCHFMYFFKRHMGLTVIQYLNQVRLEQGAKALLQSNQRVMTVSQACGFSNPSYFIRLFKTQYGLSPKQFRKQQSLDEEEPSF